MGDGRWESWNCTNLEDVRRAIRWSIDTNADPAKIRWFGGKRKTVAVSRRDRDWVGCPGSMSNSKSLNARWCCYWWQLQTTVDRDLQLEPGPWLEYRQSGSRNCQIFIRRLIFRHCRLFVHQKVRRQSVWVCIDLCQIEPVIFNSSSKLKGYLPCWKATDHQQDSIIKSV